MVFLLGPKEKEKTPIVNSMLVARTQPKKKEDANTSSDLTPKKLPSDTAPAHEKMPKCNLHETRMSDWSMVSSSSKPWIDSSHTGMQAEI